MAGPRLLLESSSVDGVLLEDGTGVLLLEEADPPGGGSPNIVEIADPWFPQRGNLIAALVVAATVVPVGHQQTAIAAWTQPDTPVQQRPAKIAPLVAVAAATQTAQPQQTAVLIAWIPAETYLQLQRKLPPSITAVAVDNPIGRRDYTPVFRAWDTPDPPLQASRRYARPVVADQPRSSINYALWQVTAPDPQQGRKLPPSITAVRVDSPIPPDWMRNVLDAWTPPEQPPQRQRKYVPEAVVAQVDLPPGAAVPKIIEIPDDPPQQRRKLYVPVAAVGDNPPFGRRVPVWSWGDDVIIPMGGAGLIQSVDRPIYKPVWLETVTRSWIAEDPALQRQRKLTTGVRVDDPPPHVRQPDFKAWIPPDPLPILPHKYVPETPAAAQVDLPPGASVPRIVELPDEPPQQRRKLYVPDTVVVADKVPFKRLHVTWPAEEVYQQRRNLTINGVRVDDPPFTQRVELDLTPWKAADPLPQVAPKYVPVAAVVTDQPYRRDYTVVYRSWDAIAPLPQISPKGINAVAVDNPPPLENKWLERLLLSWAAPDPLPTLSVKQTPPDGPAPPVVVVPPGDSGMVVGYSHAKLRKWIEELKRARAAVAREAREEATGKRKAQLLAANRAAEEVLYAAILAASDKVAAAREERITRVVANSLNAAVGAATVAAAIKANRVAHQYAAELAEEEEEMTVISLFIR